MGERRYVSRLIITPRRTSEKNVQNYLNCSFSYLSPQTLFTVKEEDGEYMWNTRKLYALTT